MRKKKIVVNAMLSSIGIFGCVIGFMLNQSRVVFYNANESSYSLTLNSGKRISNKATSYSEVVSTSVITGNGGTVTFNALDVVTYNSGWQTILPGGYFCNPLNNSTNRNKISGIKSIKYEGTDNSKLDLYFGTAPNDSEIIYSHAKVLNEGVTYNLEDEHPNYIYIKNNGLSNVNITEFNITYSCSDLGYARQTYTVLMIGNSFADDTIFYAARIANSYGITLNIYNSYIAGCTIDRHYNNLINDTAEYSMRSMNGSTWVYQNNLTLAQIIDSHTWDLITFQQASAEVGRSTTYSNLTNLVNTVKGRLNNTPKIYWHQTWAYSKAYQDYYDYYSYFNNDQMTMFNAINSCYQSQVASTGLFERIIPAGTAVQNMRTSYVGETITRDGKHMSSVHGRYLLGIDFISNVFDIDLDLSPCNYLPEEIMASYRSLCYESVRNAYKSPLSCTNSVYTNPELANYDLENDYTEIDPELVGCAYWDSTDSANYNKRIAHSSGQSNKFVSTKRFTQSDLPLGSIVVIGDAFGYRPEAWVSDSVQQSRPDNRYDNVVVIDSNFFSGYQYRAFNLFKGNGAGGEVELATAVNNACIGEQYDEIFDNFHIYVPNASVGNIRTKDVNDYYNLDKTTFTANSLKIDSFKKLHLDPITGFYKCDSYYYLLNSYVDSTAQRFVCTRPFHTADGELPENTVIIVDSGYQWRSDCWKDHGTCTRPNNVSANLTRLASSFMSEYRTRTFNVSAVSTQNVGQNFIPMLNHMRIYVPISDDIEIETPDTATMTALGYAHLNNMAAAILGSDTVNILVTLHGDSISNAKVEAMGADIGATGYTYNKTTGALSIETTGSAGGYTYGTITGVLNKDAGTISNMRINGTLSQFVTDNGSIVCSEMWHDRCNYSSNSASQLVWQRWYMSGSWQANSGSGEWTTSSISPKFDNNYVMGLRIANNQYQKTRFTLKSDFNNGSGITPHGVSIWIYNPNSSSIYGKFRIYLYKVASTISGDHAIPNSNSSNYSQVYETTSGLPTGQWKNYKLGVNVGTVYNISLYFECSSSDTTYIYLGHVSIY